MSSPVTIELTHDEALVLSAWLASADLTSPLAVPTPADRAALWAVDAQLEKILVEPFAHNDDQQIADARRRLTPD